MRLWVRLITLTVVTLIMATYSWAEVTVKPPAKPVAVKGAAVNLLVTISGEEGSTAALDVVIGDNPDGMLTVKAYPASVPLSGGKGRAVVRVAVAANPMATPRSATIAINGQEVTVEQYGLPCKVTIKPTKSSFQFYGGSGSFDVMAPAECPWSATTVEEWITLDQFEGEGNGTVIFTVDENYGKNRSGKIVVTAGGSVRSAKQHTVAQVERKQTGTVKLAPPTPLESPEAAARAFRGIVLAAEAVGFLTDSLDLLDDEITGGAPPVGLLGMSSAEGSPAPNVLGRLQPAMSAAALALDGGVDVGSDLCSNYLSDPAGYAYIDGLKFDGEGNPVPGSNMTIRFESCDMEGALYTGLVRVRGLTVNQSTMKIGAIITLGESAEIPLRVEEAATLTKAFMTLKLAVLPFDVPATVSVQANGFGEVILGKERTVVELKGVKAFFSMADGSNSYEIDGLFRQSLFKDEVFQSSYKILFADFAETDELSADPPGTRVTLNGRMAIDSTPDGTCTDGSFDVVTDPLAPILISGDLPVAGQLAINNADIVINADGSITATVGAASGSFTPKELDDFCPADF